MIVPERTVPQRVDRYLTSVLRELSRTQIQRLLRDGHVRIGGRPVKPAHKVAPGQELLIEIPPPAPSQIKPEPIPLKVLYEDDHLLVVDKPAGMVVHPAPGHAGGTLVNALLAHADRLSGAAGVSKPGIVHRLDRDTSGLIVAAKDDSTHRALARQFADRKVKRIYLAIVQGVVQQDEGTISAPIGRHPTRRQRMAVRYGAGREAVSRYRVLRRFKEATLLELSLQTGRTHQIRVHLSHLGHPLLGDARYGLPAGLPRQALHAHRLGFEHPKSGRWVEFASPLPALLRRFLKGL